MCAACWGRLATLHAGKVCCMLEACCTPRGGEVLHPAPVPPPPPPHAPQVTSRTQNVPLEKVIDDVAVMGFSRSEVCVCVCVCVRVCEKTPLRGWAGWEGGWSWPWTMGQTQPTPPPPTHPHRPHPHPGPHRDPGDGGPWSVHRPQRGAGQAGHAMTSTGGGASWTSWPPALSTSWTGWPLALRARAPRGQATGASGHMRGGGGSAAAVVVVGGTQQQRC